MPRVSPARSVRASVLLSLALTMFVTSSAHAGLRWLRTFGGGACESPNTFNSSRHIAGVPPCCPMTAGVCPGGNACPGSGICPGPEAAKCVPLPGTPRPNVVLMISDDQGYCHYGTAGECRSVQTGTPIPAPITPNLDVLAGHGTVFPIAHNTSAWCYPSLNSILTGRYQRSFGGKRNAISQVFVTIPEALRNLNKSAGTVVDTFDGTARVGGYCTMQGGKFTGATGRPRFDARTSIGEHRLGRIDCANGGPGVPPQCGTDADPTGYNPFQLKNMDDLFTFIDSMLYKLPGTASSYGVNPFFVWYAPRIPHQPLRSPPAIESYLFGGLPAAEGGLFQLGSLCTGGVCAPEVTAFQENNFGTVSEFYSNVWWVDANVREIRKFLERESAPHCVGSTGQSRFNVSQAQCGLGWATSVTPNLADNTVFVYLSDNGWHLPRSKHNFSENGYRTRLVIFDPRSLGDTPSADPTGQTPPAPYESPALAHSSDILPTVLGYALNSPTPVPCPQSLDGTPCDGRDLRPHLAAAPSTPPATDPSTLRKSLCGHFTQRGTAPTRQRYLLTRPGSVGRCVNTAASACASNAQCDSDEACVGGRCVETTEPTCSSNAQCTSGAVCIAGRCRVAPACIDDDDCDRLFPGGSFTCAAKEEKWCRNAPSASCDTHDDCPACPTVNGEPTACSRLCEPRMFKFYERAARNEELTDLFLDPDEAGLHGGAFFSISTELSNPVGPYSETLKKLACCVQDWWPEAGTGGMCMPGYECPADLVCG